MAEGFRSFTSAIVPLAAENVDTDQIVPARYLKVTDKEGLADALFRDWRFNEDGTITFEWDGASSNVRLEHTPTLTPPAWSEIAGPFTGTTLVITPDPNQPMGFYRLRLR